MTYTEPDELRQMRQKAQLTHAQAAAIVGVNERLWRYWEYGTHKMKPALRLRWWQAVEAALAQGLYGKALVRHVQTHETRHGDAVAAFLHQRLHERRWRQPRADDIRALRQKLQQTQAAMAARCQVTQVSWWRWEAGQVAMAPVVWAFCALPPQPNWSLPATGACLHARRTAGITQMQAAALIEVSESHWRNVERDARPLSALQWAVWQDEAARLAAFIVDFSK